MCSLQQITCLCLGVLHRLDRRILHGQHARPHVPVKLLRERAGCSRQDAARHCHLRPLQGRHQLRHPRQPDPAWQVGSLLRHGPPQQLRALGLHHEQLQQARHQVARLRAGQADGLLVGQG